MPTIPSSQVMPLFTTALFRWYDERLTLKSPNFFESFFPADVRKERYPAYEVRRATEKVAIEVPRGSAGNRNSSQKSSLKSVDPFFFFEYFDATELDVYQKLFASGEWNVNTMTDLVNGIGMQQMENKAKIQRAIEIMRAEILLSGTVTSQLDNTVQINYGRKPQMMVDPGAGNYWNDEAANPYKTFVRAGERLRLYGKVQSNILNAIVGDAAISELYLNDIWLNRQKLYNADLDGVIRPEQKDTLGRYHGTITADNYIVRLWTYSEIYEDPATGEMKKFMDENSVYVLPDKPNFATVFGACPQLVDPGTATFSLEAADFAYRTYIDPWKSQHLFGIMSAPLPVPIAVDCMYTETVVNPSA